MYRKDAYELDEHSQERYFRIDNSKYIREIFKRKK